jgi:D-alanyl-D-alanine carboxypeptidase (penicillin-binding protein 5/6)
MRRSIVVLIACALGALGVATPARAASVRVDGAAAILLDPRDGRVLYEKSPDARRAPASLTKMVTALAVADTLKPDDTVRISRAAATAEADQIRWPEGATFSVDQLMHAMLMTSSNGAAIALAERASGSVPAFRSKMNLRAAQAGATNTVLVDPSGLDAPGQYTTARDMAAIARTLMTNPWLRSIVATLEYVVPWPNGKTVIVFSIDKFLRRYPGAIGVKNGYTTLAQNNLAAAATRKGVTLVAVSLGSPSAYDDATRLMNYGFSLVKGTTFTTTAPAAVASPAVVEPSASATPSVAASTEPQQRVAASPARGSGKGRWLLFFGAVAYVGRVVQVRRRRVARRRARARLAARRRLEAQRYEAPAQRFPVVYEDAPSRSGARR